MSNLDDGIDWQSRKWFERDADMAARERALVYKNEIINDARGLPYAVLDMEKNNFAKNSRAAYGMKTAPTFAFRGEPGQKVITSQGDNVETSFTCEGGEVVFINILPPDGKLDAYVPRDKEGKSTGEQILRDSYDIVSGSLTSPGGGLFRPKPNPAKILLEVVEKPTVIADAYGPGQHVFLEPGATLKIAGTSVSGINPVAFDATWAVTDERGTITRPARPPAPDFYSIERFQQVLGR